MSRSAIQDQWLYNVIDQLRSLAGVECENATHGEVRLKISYNGETRELFVAVAGIDYRTQKIQYSQLRNFLTELGLKEGKIFLAAKLPRRPMTREMRAAREQKKNTFDAWQDVWRTLRKAEKALDVDYEIAQMRDYY